MSAFGIVPVGVGRGACRPVGGGVVGMGATVGTDWGGVWLASCGAGVVAGAVGFGVASFCASAGAASRFNSSREGANPNPTARHLVSRIFILHPSVFLLRLRGDRQTALGVFQIGEHFVHELAHGVYGEQHHAFAGGVFPDQQFVTGLYFQLFAQFGRNHDLSALTDRDRSIKAFFRFVLFVQFILSLLPGFVGHDRLCFP